MLRLDEVANRRYACFKLGSCDGLLLGAPAKQSVLMATPPSDKPDLENLSKDELIAMVMAAAEEKKEKACAPHDSAALACLLSL